MRRGILSVLFILSLATAGLPAQQADPGERVVVAVLPLVHEMEARELAAAGRVVMDTIALTLRILGGYQVVRPEEQASERNLPRLRELAESSGYNNILFGSSTRSGSGSLAFTLSAYDRKQDRITVTRTAVAESLFDLFDLSDRLAAALVEGFSGVHVAFGSLKIDRRGGPGTWHLAVNGERVGENLSGIDRLPTGRHRVSVTQDRLLGTLTLFDGKVTVAENGIATVLVDLPFTTPEEAAAFSRLDRELLYAWARPPIASTAIWEELYALLRKGAGAAEYAELAGKYEEWESRYRRFHRNTASVTAHREPVPAAVELLAASTTPAAFRSALPGGVPLEAAGGEAGSDNATLSSIVEGSFNFFLAEGKIRGQSIAARAMNADVVSHPASDDRSKTELRIRASAGSDQVTVSFNLDGLESGGEYSVKEGDRYNCAIDSTILLKQVGFMSHPVKSGTLQIQRFDKAVLAGSFSFTTGIGDTLEGRFLLSGLPYRPGKSRPRWDGFVLVETGTF